MALPIDLPSFLITLLITLITIYLLLKTFTSLPTKNANLPPGPFRLPFIGNLHQLAFSLPHIRLRQLAEKYGPLMHLHLGQVSTVVISSPEAAKEVMRTHDIVFANRPNTLLGQILFYDSSDIVFSPWGEYWRKLRNICTLELLTPKRVHSFQHTREEVVTNCMKSIGQKSGSNINLTEIILSTTNNIVAKTALGLEGKDQEAFARILEEALKVATESGMADLFPSVKLIEFITGVRRRLENMFAKTNKMMEDIVNDQRAKRKLRRDNNEENDQLFVDVLLKFEDHATSDFSLTTDNIKAVLLDVWMAGTETTAGTIEWAMSEMLKNPSVMQKAQDEVRQMYKENQTVDESKLHKLQYLKHVIKETLRLHPPLPLLIPRESYDQRQIFGYDIPSKTQIIVNAWAIGRDPKVWTDPESFCPERFNDTVIDYKGNNFELIPFGAGRRLCPGLSYGLAVVEIMLAMLLFHFDWKLPDGLKPADLDMSENLGISVTRKSTLHVIPIPYQSSFVSQVL